MESTQIGDAERMVRVQARGPGFIQLTSGVRLNEHGKVDEGNRILSIVPLLFGVSEGWVAILK